MNVRLVAVRLTLSKILNLQYSALVHSARGSVFSG